MIGGEGLINRDVDEGEGWIENSLVAKLEELVDDSDGVDEVEEG